ncbi:unnamed protein product, partial [Acanthoscelides obtectus]
MFQHMRIKMMFNSGFKCTMNTFMYFTCNRCYEIRMPLNNMIIQIHVMFECSIT